MFDSPMELLDKIQLGEDTHLELKSVRFGVKRIEGPHKDGVADRIAAMANGAGGVIVFGVDDSTRAIEGIPLDRLDELEHWLIEIVRDTIEPTPLVQTTRLRLPSTSGPESLVPVLKLDVQKSLFVHRSPNGFFIRQGSSTVKMSMERLARLIQQRSYAGLIRFDESAVPGTTIEDIDEASVGHLLPPDDDRETAFQKVLLATATDGDVLMATVAGILVYGRNPQRFLPGARIECVSYRGTEADSNYQLDAATVNGTLRDQVEGAVFFVDKNSRSAGAHRDGRVETPEYDQRAIYEAIVNAVAHRDYALGISHIRLRMFSDRLELSTPGALPNSVTVETLATRQATRNELIVRFLSKTEIGAQSPRRRYVMEGRGEGVPLILSRSRELSGRLPEYQLFGEELRLTIWKADFPRISSLTEH